MNKLLLLSIFTTLLLVLSGFVLADYTIESLDFKVGSNDVEYIKLQSSQVVDIFLNVSTNETLERVYADLTKVNPNPTQFLSYKNKTFICINSQIDELNYYSCKISNVVFIPQEETSGINLTLVFEENINNTYFEKTFSIDNTNPQLTSFTTNFCNGDKCFIPNLKPANISFEFSDSTASFDQEKIFYTIGDSPVLRVTSCEGNSCNGIYTYIGCSSGERLLSELVSAQGVFSSDDAGNPVEGEIKKNFICDEVAPGIQNIQGEDYSVIFNLTHDGGALFDRPKSGDTITIVAKISEDASGVVAESNLTSVGGAYQSTTCVANPGGLDYNCTFKVSNVNAGSHQISVLFIDGVGRETTKSFEFFVDTLVVLEDGETTPKFLKDIEAFNPAKNGINRVALSLAYENDLSYPLNVMFTPEKNTAVPGRVELLYTQISEVDTYGCEVYDNGDRLNVSSANFVRFGVVDPLLDMNQENKISFKLLKDPNDIPDNLELVCNVSSIVRIDGDKIYPEPAKFLVTIPLKFRNSRLGDEAPGKAYADRILETKENTKTFNNIIDVMNKIYVNLQDICNAKKFMNGASFSFANAQVITGVMADSPFSKASPQVQQTLEKTSTTSGKIKDKLNTLSASDSDLTLFKTGEQNFPTSLNIGDILSQSCELVTCSIDAQDDKTGFSIGENIDANSWFKETDPNFFQGMGQDAATDIFDGVNLPNVESSLVSAVAARCLPAVVSHLNSYRQMNCNTITCMKTQAAYGTDISVCDQAKSQFVCEKIVGEVFDVGGPRQVKNVMDNTNAYVQNLIPNTLKSLTQNSFCKGYATLSNSFIGDSVVEDSVGGVNTLKLLTCTIPEVVANRMNLARKTTQNNKVFNYPTNEDVCGFAYCDSINPEDCNIKSSSLIEQYTGMRIPTSTLDLISSGIPGVSIETYESSVKSSNMNTEERKAYVQQVKSQYSGSSINTDNEEETTKTITVQELKKQFDEASTSSQKAKVFYEAPTISTDGLSDDVKNDLEIMRAYSSYYSRNSKNTGVTEEDYTTYLKLLNSDDLESKYTLDKINGVIKSDYTYAEYVENQNVLENTLEKGNAYLREQDDRVVLINQKIQEQKALVLTCGELDVDCANKHEYLIKEYEKVLAEQQAYIKKLTDSDGNIVMEKLFEEKRAQLQAKKEKLYALTDVVVSIAMQKGFLNWASLSSYGENTLAGQVSDFSDTWLNSDNYKNSICSANFIVSKDSQSQQGAAIQCKNSLCVPVLSQAVEKIEINSTHQLYTATYSLGNVKASDFFSGDEVINFNVFFKGKNGLSEKLFNVTWLSVPYSAIAGDTFAFLSDGNYDEMCIVFDQDFPPDEINKKKTYCRPIVDATLNFETDFDTGSPVPADYMDKVKQTITTAPGKVPMNVI